MQDIWPEDVLKVGTSLYSRIPIKRTLLFGTSPECLLKNGDRPDLVSVQSCQSGNRDEWVARNLRRLEQEHFKPQIGLDQPALEVQTIL